MEVTVDTCKLSQLLLSHGNTQIVKIPTQKGIDKLNWASGEGEMIFHLNILILFMWHVERIILTRK